MPGPYISPAQLYQQIADAVHQDVNLLAEEFRRQAATAVEDAYVDVVGVLTAKGYDIATIDAADQRATWNRRRALYLLGNRMAGYGDFSLTAFQSEDPLPWLKETPQPILVAGVPVAPGTRQTAVGGIAGGMSTAADAVATQFTAINGDRFCGVTRRAW